MTARPDAARILVASDNADDAHQIVRLLKLTFEQVRSSTQPARAGADFDDARPDVLVLAFDSLDKAQRYYLGLYRLNTSIQSQPHRTVILCRKEELREVFELCKQDYFDDYVLYWPQSYDGSRLAMSIWIACREMQAKNADTPATAELRAHASRLDELGRLLDAQLSDSERRISAAEQSVADAERGVAGAIDGFTERLTQDGAGAWIQVRDAAVLAGEASSLKQQQLTRMRQAGGAGIDALRGLTQRLKAEIAPAMTGARQLAERIRQIRAQVLVVDDDRYMRELISSALTANGYQTTLAADAPSALSQLRRYRPDLMLVDIGLPGLDGVSLTERVKADPTLAAIPVIIITGEARRETLQRSVDAGATAFLVKPFKTEVLMERLARALQG